MTQQNGLTQGKLNKNTSFIKRIFNSRIAITASTYLESRVNKIDRSQLIKNTDQLIEKYRKDFEGLSGK